MVDDVPDGPTPAAIEEQSGIRGVWFAVDVGTVRVGVARCDPRGVLAVPVTTLARDRRRDHDLDELAALVAEYEAVGVVVGLPRTLRGAEGASAIMARDYGASLAQRLAPVPVNFVDERLTTVTAQRKLRQSGVRGPAGRAVVDQAAAVEMLQHWLDLNRPPAHRARHDQHRTDEHDTDATADHRPAGS